MAIDLIVVISNCYGSLSVSLQYKGDVLEVTSTEPETRNKLSGHFPGPHLQPLCLLVKVLDGARMEVHTLKVCPVATSWACCSPALFPEHLQSVMQLATLVRLYHQVVVAVSQEERSEYVCVLGGSTHVKRVGNAPSCLP